MFFSYFPCLFLCNYSVKRRNKCTMCSQDSCQLNLSPRNYWYLLDSCSINSNKWLVELDCFKKNLCVGFRVTFFCKSLHSKLFNLLNKSDLCHFRLQLLNAKQFILDLNWWCHILWKALQYAYTGSFLHLLWKSEGFPTYYSSHAVFLTWV